MRKLAVEYDVMFAHFGSIIGLHVHHVNKSNVLLDICPLSRNVVLGDTLEQQDDYDDEDDDDDGHGDGDDEGQTVDCRR